VVKAPIFLPLSNPPLNLTALARRKLTAYRSAVAIPQVGCLAGAGPLLRLREQNVLASIEWLSEDLI
jgi:hypothetical protein